MIGVGVSLRASLAAGKFSPRALFALSEPGVWYDPSDLTTMFQDRAGTTLVTTPGQSVGLVLDKSQGLVLGPELVTNGTFDTDSAWAKQSNWSIGGGVATYSGTGADLLSQNIGAVNGRTYLIEWTSTAFVRFRLGSSSTNVFEGIGSRAIVRASGTDGTLYIRPPTAPMTIDNISVREIPGNHMVAVSDAARGTYNVDSNSKAFILFDGADDGYLTSTITPGTDKVQVFAGVRKLSDVAIGILTEISTGIANGSFFLAAPRNAGQANYGFSPRGTNSTDAIGGIFAAPISNVLTGLGDISGDLATLRVNGTQVAQSTADQGTGNFLAYPLYIGRRGGTSLPFNGRLYQMVVRFGPNLDAARIAQVERFINSKTGAY